MKKIKMDYDRIMDVCKVIGIISSVVTVIVGVIGVWAYFKNKEVKKIEDLIEENRTVKIEDDISLVKNDLVNIKDDLVEEVLRRILEERRQISINYGDLPKEEQDQILRDRFNLSSQEIDGLITKATKRTESFISQAMGYELKYDYSNAIKFYEKALEEAASDKDKAWILAQIGMQYMDLKKYVEAKRNYELSLELYDKIIDKKDKELNDIAAIYTDLGIINRSNGGYLEAIINHEKALDIREDLIKINRDKYILNLSMSYNNLGVVYKHQGDLDRSIDNYEKALNIRKELAFKSNEVKDMYFVSRSLNNMGNAYFAKNNNLKAKENMLEGIDLALGLKGKINEVLYKENITNLYVNYGRILNRLKEYKDSKKLLQKAIVNYEDLIKINKNQYIESYTEALYQLAEVHKSTNNIDKSIDIYKINIDTLKSIKNRSGDTDIRLANSYYSLGLVYLDNRFNAKLALDNFNSAYNIYIKYKQTKLAIDYAGYAKERIDYLKTLN